MKIKGLFLSVSVYSGLVMLAWIKLGYCVKCSMCDTEKGDDFCFNSPPMPQTCTFCDYPENNSTNETTSPVATRPQPDIPCQHYDFCIIRKLYINGTLTHITRGCFPYGIRTIHCNTGIDIARNGMKVKLCDLTCDTDGCNGARKTVTGFNQWFGVTLGILLIVFNCYEIHITV